GRVGVLHPSRSRFVPPPRWGGRLARRFRSKFVFPVASPFRLRGVTASRPCLRFQSPPPRTQSADFPHYAHLFASHQGLWGLSCWSDFRLRPSNPVAIEQLEVRVQPPPTPPRPAEALALPGSHQVASNLPLHPGLNEVEALAGVSDREVIHPSTYHRVDLLDHPLHGLGTMAAKHDLELSQQCRSFLELRRILHAPVAPSTTDAAEVKPQKAEALAPAEIHDPTLLLIDLDL